MVVIFVVSMLFLLLILSVMVSVIVVNRATSSKTHLRDMQRQTALWPISALMLIALMYGNSGRGELGILLFFYLMLSLVGVFLLLCEVIARAAAERDRYESEYLWFAALEGPITSGVAVS